MTDLELSYLLAALAIAIIVVGVEIELRWHD